MINKICCLLMVCITVLLFQGCNLVETSKIGKSGIYEYTVGNMDVLHVKSKSSGIAAMNLYYRSDYIDGEYYSGIDSLLLNVLDNQETNKYTASEIEQMKTEHMIKTTTGCTNEYGAIYTRFFEDDFQTAIDVLYQLVFDSKFNEESFGLCRDSCIQKTSTPSFDEIMFSGLYNMYYEDYYYSKNPVGTPQDLQNISFDLLKRYYEENIVGRKVQLVIVGNISDTSVKSELEKLNNEMIKEDNFCSDENDPKHKNMKDSYTKLHFIDTEYKGIVAFSNFQAQDEQEILQLQFIRQLLESRLENIIRNKYGLAYIINVMIDIGRPNSFIIQVISDDTLKVSQIIEEELENIRNKKYDSEEFETTKKAFATEFLLNLEDRSNLAGFLGESKMLGYDTTHLVIDTTDNGNETIILGDNDVMLQKVIDDLIDNMEYFLIGNYTQNEKQEIEKVLRSN